MNVAEKCREEKYAEKYWSERCLNWRLKRRTSQRCVYLVWDDDGNEIEWTLFRASQHMASTMRLFQELFDAKKEW